MGSLYLGTFSGVEAKKYLKKNYSKTGKKRKKKISFMPLNTIVFIWRIPLRNITTKGGKVTQKA